VSSSTATRPFTQRKQYPDVEASGRLFCGTDRIEDIVRGRAVVDIHGGGRVTSFWLEAVLDAGKIVALRLRKFGTGEVHQVTLEGGTFVCDCPDSTFRNRSCRHVAGLHSALCHPE